MPDFLLEIGTEEIPARMIEAAAGDLRQRVQDLMARHCLAGADFESFTTPRRITVVGGGVAEDQGVSKDQITGPSVNIAYKDGVPTPAAHAFAKKVGPDLSQLHRVTTPKGEYVAAWVEKSGRRAVEILVESLPKEIAS